MEFSEIGERLGDAIKKEASVYYTRTNERNEDVTADFVLMNLADYLESIGGTYGISKLMRAVIFYMRYSKDSDSYKEDVERVMRSVSDNAQHYAMYSKELDLLLSALRTIYPQQ